jgi:hypothetical protein
MHVPLLHIDHTMSDNQPKKNPVEALKNTYIGMLDQASELAKQPLESAKKMIGATLDAQTHVWNSFAKDPAMTQFRDMTSMGTNFIELYSKRISEGFEMTKKGSEAMTEIALSWQRVMLDAQMNAFNAYKNWFTQFRA